MPPITTLGQMLVNDALPDEYRDYSRVLGKDEADKMLAEIAKKRPENYKDISWKLMQLGREAAFTEGTTLKLSDLLPKFDKTDLIEHVRIQERKIMASKDLTPEEKEKTLEAVYAEVQKALTDQTYQAALQAGNPFALQVKSKARGNPVQLAALMTTPGVYQDANDRTIPVFIRRSYAEGLDPHEYWAATYGARKGVICLSSDTRVVMSDFTEKRIDEIHIGDEVFASDMQGNLHPSKVVRVHAQGLQPMNEYTFRKLASQEFVTVRCTQNHKLLSYIWHAGKRGEARKKYGPDLHPMATARITNKSGANNYVAIPSKGVISSTFHKSEPLALLLGLFLGDGCCSPKARTNYTFSCADTSLITDILPYLELHGLTLVKSGGKNYNWRLTYVDMLIGKQTKQWLTYQCGGLYAHEKVLPPDVMAWDDASLGALIGGLLSTDGSFVRRKSSRWVTFQVTSKQLVESLKRILELRFGIWCGPTYCVSKETKQWATHDQYGFKISHPDSLLKLRQIVKLVGCKERKFESWNLSTDYIRYSAHGFRIKAITEIGELPAFDLEIADPGHKYLLANGLITENSTKFSTRDAGYLGKQLGVAVNDLVVTEDDCETPQGIPVKATDRDNLGAVLARPVAGFPRGTIIDRSVLADLEKKDVDEIVVRSPTMCRLSEGVCKQCTGQREDGKFPEIGHHLGLNAASAVAERIAQSQLNQKHSGGQGSKGETVYTGFDIIEQLAQIPKTFPHRATLSDMEGKITRIEPAPQGGTLVYVNDQEHYVSPDMTLKVKVDDAVERGDQLSSGIVNPAEVVRYKGIGEGRRYFVDRFTQALRESKYDVNRRNVEALARSMIDHVTVDEADGLGDYLSGDTVKYNSLAYSYRPRKDAKQLPTRKAVGQYLEQPTLHLTIGTQLTGKMADQLNKHGITDVLVHPQSAGFTPDMVSLVKQPEYDEDWMARLGSNYLESRLLQDVQRGAKSNIHGLNPIPGIAKGVEFGHYKGPGYKY